LFAANRSNLESLTPDCPLFWWQNYTIAAYWWIPSYQRLTNRLRHGFKVVYVWLDRRDRDWLLDRLDRWNSPLYW
jgi:hypothetical protein